MGRRTEHLTLDITLPDATPARLAKLLREVAAAVEYGNRGARVRDEQSGVVGKFEVTSAG